MIHGTAALVRHAVILSSLVQLDICLAQALLQRPLPDCTQFGIGRPYRAFVKKEASGSPLACILNGLGQD